MKTRAIVVALFVAASLAVLSANAVSALQPAAASPKAAPLVIQVGVDLIQIDASITDKSGRAVTDLRAEDLILEVDGKKQPITNTAYVGESAPSTPEGISPEGFAESDCTVVFLIDDLNMSFASMYATREALMRFATEMGPSHPLVALRLASDEQDRYSLYRSADRFVSAVSGLKYNIRSSKGIRSASDASPFSSTTTLNRNTYPIDPASRLTPTEEMQNLEQRAFSLVSNINTLRGIPGRKAVVFVSEGFYVDTHVHNQLAMGLPFSLVFDDGNIAASLRMITEVANRASVVLYPVDPRGMMVDFPGVADRVTSRQAGELTASRRDERIGSQASLQYLADDTGGLAIASRNDLRGGLGDVLRDQRSYYLVGFEPPEGTFHKGSSGRPRFHKIKLSVNRKGVRVRTRAGFYGVTDEEVTKRAPLTTAPEF